MLYVPSTGFQTIQHLTLLPCLTKDHSDPAIGFGTTSVPVLSLCFQDWSSTKGDLYRSVFVMSFFKRSRSFTGQVDEVLQSSPNGMQPATHKRTSIPSFVRNYSSTDGRGSPRPRSNNNNHSALCEQCRGRLAELKRQVLRILVPYTSRGVPLPRVSKGLAVHAHHCR